MINRAPLLVALEFLFAVFVYFADRTMELPLAVEVPSPKSWAHSFIDKLLGVLGEYGDAGNLEGFFSRRADFLT